MTGKVRAPTRLDHLPELDGTLLDLVERQAERQPDATAMHADARSWTFAEVARASAGIATGLEQAGPRLVGIATRCPVRRHLAYLGAMRAGVVVTSLPPGKAEERARAVVSAAQPGAILLDGDEAWAEAIAPGITAMDVDDLATTVPQPPSREVTGGTPAEVVFTSGSTGTPRPFVRSQAGTARPSLHLECSRGLGPGDRVTHLDVGLFGGPWGLPGVSLALGAAVHFFDVQGRGAAGIPAWIDEHRVTVLRGTASLWRIVVDSMAPGRVLESVRAVLYGGEPVHADDARGLGAHLPADAVITVGYGATEIGMVSWGDVTADDLRRGGPLPAGTGVPERPVVVVDDEGRPVPPGTTGQVMVTGTLIGRPLTLAPDDPAEVRTQLVGDRGRLLPDGRLLVLGRADDAVNVHGMRIDPGEVEACLLAHPAVAGAAVMAASDGDSLLAAVAVASDQAAPTPHDLVEHVRERLPGPMVPSHVTVLDELPRLDVGKVDRLAVRELVERDRTVHRATATRVDDSTADPLVLDVASFMAQVLELPAVGPGDHFFELGGSSIQAARLYSLLLRHLDADLPLSSLLEHPTPRLLAELVRTPPPSRTHLVPVHRGAEHRTPLFFLHGAMGHVLWVPSQADGLGDRNAWAIEAPYVDGRRAPEQTIEALALRYVAAIRAHQPTGPYAIAGYSFGGLVAAEIGRHLHLDGQQVGLVAIGDTIAPGMLASAQEVAERVERHRTNLRGRRPAQAVAYAKRLAHKRLRRAKGLLGLALATEARPAPGPLRERARSEHARRLALRYDPPPLPIPLVLHRATRSHGPADRGWAALAPEGLEIVHIEGTHKDLRRPGAGTLVGEDLERRLLALDRTDGRA